MNKLSKIIVATFAMFMILISSTSSVFAAGGDFIPTDHRSHVGSVALTYNQYPASQYQMDMYVPNQPSGILHMGNEIDQKVNAVFLRMENFFWEGYVTVVTGVIYMVNEAFHLNIFKQFSGYISNAIKHITGFDGSNSLFKQLLIIAVFFAGIWAAYMALVRRRAAGAMSGILGMILMIGIAFGYIMNAGTILTGLNNASSELSSGIFDTMNSVVDPGHHYSTDEGIAAMDNKVFDLLVFKPYLLLQYGTDNVSKINAKHPNRIKSLLSKPYGSQQRQKIVKHEYEQLHNQMMGSGKLNNRGIILLMTILPMIAGSFVLLFFAVNILFYQFLVIIYAIALPIALLISVIPGFNNTGWKAIIKLIHAALMKVMISFFLTLMFMMLTLVYRFTQNQPYIICCVLFVIVTIGMFLYRKKILNIVPTHYSSQHDVEHFHERVKEKIKIQKERAKKKFNSRNGYSQSTNQQVNQTVNRTHGIAQTESANVATTQTKPSFVQRNETNRSQNATQPTQTTQKRPNVSRTVGGDNRNTEQNVRPAHAQTSNRNINHNQRDLESLQKTTEKGGWAYDAPHGKPQQGALPVVSHPETPKPTTRPETSQNRSESTKATGNINTRGQVETRQIQRDSVEKQPVQNQTEPRQRIETKNRPVERPQTVKREVAASQEVTAK